MALKRLSNKLSPLLLVNIGLGLVCLVIAVFLILNLSKEKKPAVWEGENIVQRGRQPVWSWFSQDESLLAVAEEYSDEQYDEINIQAELMGVVITPSSSFATIRVNSEEKVFHVGEELQSGIEVERIEPSRVVLSQRGRMLQLSFPEAEMLARVVTKSGTGSELRETGQQGVQLPGMFSGVPVEVNTYNGGLRMADISEEIQGLIDIRDGDVVVQVGTSSIQDILSSPAKWISLGIETNLPVTVIRDGKERVIYVNALSLSAKLLPTLK